MSIASQRPLYHFHQSESHVPVGRTGGNALAAPHQAPFEVIKSYDAVFRDGWDAERFLRIQRQKAMGIVPAATRLPPRNDGVQA